MSLLEAMAAGCRWWPRRSAASRGGGRRRERPPRRAGRHGDARAPLRRLLHDRALAARLGAAARESVRLRFAPERALPRLEALYAARPARAWRSRRSARASSKDADCGRQHEAPPSLLSSARTATR